MYLSIAFRLFCGSRVRLLTLLLLLPLSAFCAEQSGPKYDPSTESKFKGTVEDLKLPPRGKEKEIAHLLLKTGSDTLDVYLCPKSFMDDMGVTFAKGEEIELTGSKVKLGDTEMILARQVVRGSETLVFRDEKGNPVWIWQH